MLQWTNINTPEITEKIETENWSKEKSNFNTNRNISTEKYSNWYKASVDWINSRIEETEEKNKQMNNKNKQQKWDYSTRSNIHVIGILEILEKEIRTEKSKNNGWKCPKFGKRPKTIDLSTCANLKLDKHRFFIKSWELKTKKKAWNHLWNIILLGQK
jgi:hypothetical protein